MFAPTFLGNTAWQREKDDREFHVKQNRRKCLAELRDNHVSDWSESDLGLTREDLWFINKCLIGNPKLTLPQVADIFERTIFRNIADLENYQFGSGDMICKVCGFPFSRHPNPKGHEYLTVICDGLLVKL